ncbi:MAG TPA: ABC transporter substrate-binding protein, partial [Actinomycetota bacterium]|nr:ABC transporter substrate-binding protein [Actinomycetota bacterium]
MRTTRVSTAPHTSRSKAAALVAVCCSLLAACEPAATPPQPHQFPPPTRATTLVQQGTSMPFDSALDPTSEYTSLGFALLTQLLVRPLMSYRHVEGPAGADVVPDLAAAMPEVSDDGTTYSFRIRDGVRFGPPLDRPVTSADVAFAFERAADPEIGSPYRFYFTSAIEGMQAVSDGDASSITGIETPDAETIVFHLTQPTGDFLDRLTLPATAPIPREIAGCFDRSRGYGPNLVATGPFTIEGSDDLDPTSCDSLTPAPGFDPSKHLSLVRNPDYDPATDDPGIRDPGFDRYRFSIEEDPTKTLTRLEKGRVDLSTGDVGIDTLRRYVSDPKLRKRLHVEQDDRLWYLAMNL